MTFMIDLSEVFFKFNSMPDLKEWVIHKLAIRVFVFKLLSIWIRMSNVLNPLWGLTSQLVELFFCLDINYTYHTNQSNICIMDNIILLPAKIIKYRCVYALKPITPLEGGQYNNFE